MPLVKRAVEPVFISRATLDKGIKNELEGVVVNSLAGVIKQLSSISKHAENLFGELFSDANAIYQRTAELSQRVAVVHQQVASLDAAMKEEAKVEDFSFQAHFKSTRVEESQSLHRNTLPTALQEVYRSCDQPPKLQLFTPYRDDNKPGLKFYTDSNYFHDLWVKDQNKLLEKKRIKKKKGRRKKANQPKKPVAQATRKRFESVDKEFRQSPVVVQRQSLPPSDMPPDGSYLPEAQPAALSESYAQDHRPSGPPPPPLPSSTQLTAPTVPPPPPPPALGGPVPPPPPPPPMGGGPPAVAPPPPPTQPLMPGMYGGAPSPLPPGYHSQAPMAPPPPPPNIPAAPAPPPAPTGPPAPPPPAIMGSSVQASSEMAKPAKQPEDNRSHLLQAIQMGMQLRKVERTAEEKQTSQYGNDVASILKRRIAMELSESESDGSDSEDDWSS